MSIFGNLEKYQHSIRFHTPGHKGRMEHEPIGLAYIDMTELKDTDCLHRPQGVIDQAQKRIADVYKVAESRMLVNGSSGGLLASIMASFSPKDKVLLPRGSHLSVYHGLMLQDIEPVYVYPDASLPAEAGTIRLEDILAAEQKHALAGLIVTYPTYLGTCADIAKIAVWAQDNAKILLVDEAHGAHLALCEDYPIAAERTGADIVVQSTHKMLSSLTQSAVLHIASNKVDRAKLDLYLRLFQSSSPSYLLLASLEEAINYAAKNAREAFATIAKSREMFSRMLAGERFELWQPKGIYDPAKWVIFLRDKGLEGREVLRQLSEKNIEMEYGADNFVLAYCGIGTTKDDIIKLSHALNDIEPNKKNATIQSKYSYPPATARMSMKEAVAQKSAYLSVQQSAGHISADFVVPYPPGIPLLVPGEVISDEIAKMMVCFNQRGQTVLGVHGGEVKVIQ